MPKRVPVDTSIVGIDLDFNGTDSCCIATLTDQEATPNGIGVVCDVCGDVWVSQIKEDGGVVWFRTYAGSYSTEVRAKIAAAAQYERKVKGGILLSIAFVVLVVIVWNIIDYFGESQSLGNILFGSASVIFIATAASFALFGTLFRKFSRNGKKLKYEIASTTEV